MANHNLAIKQTLEWYLDHGVDEVLGDDPIDRTVQKPLVIPKAATSAPTPISTPATPQNIPISAVPKADLKDCTTLDALRQAITDYDGIAIKRNATNLVFADGNPEADIMLIGEAPGADEDRQGMPFVGANGQLLDRILNSINLARNEEDTAKSVYLTNILNWRPPGNRTPNAQEIEASLPFIEKHIALVNPKLIILCGGVAAKTLLNSTASISRLRGKFHDYTPRTIDGAKPIPAIATYHPEYLLRTPSQKKAVWIDMLTIQKKLRDV